MLDESDPRFKTDENFCKQLTTRAVSTMARFQFDMLKRDLGKQSDGVSFADSNPPATAREKTGNVQGVKP